MALLTVGSLAWDVDDDDTEKILGKLVESASRTVSFRTTTLDGFVLWVKVPAGTPASVQSQRTQTQDQAEYRLRNAQEF